jgi:hypothetical protein
MVKGSQVWDFDLLDSRVFYIIKPYLGGDLRTSIFLSLGLIVRYIFLNVLYTVKIFIGFTVPKLTKLVLAGNNLIIPGQGEWIPVGTGKP